MGRAMTYLTIMIFVSIIFFFMGITVDCSDGEELCHGTTPTSALLNTVMNPESLQDLTIENLVKSALLGVALAGVIAGALLFKNDLAAFGPIAASLLIIGFDFVTVFTKIAEQERSLAVLFIAPVLFLYIITIAEWWRGRD